MKQQMARKIENASMVTRNNHEVYDCKSNSLGHVLDAIAKLDCFVAKVAETVNKSMSFGYQVAKVSDKQAWILACAAVENNIEWHEYNMYGQVID